MAATDVGTGTTITFQTGLLAEIANIDLGGAELPVIDAPYMGQGTTKKKIVGRSNDMKPVVVELNLNADNNWNTPMNAAAESVTITFPTPAGGSSGATYAFSGKMIKWSGAIPVEDKMMATIEIQPLGAITFTASA